MMRSPVVGCEVWIADISARTHWVFVRLESASGIVGWGEGTLDSRVDDVVAALKQHGAALLAHRFHSADAIEWLPSPADLVQASSISALDQALHDLASREAGISVAALLGGCNRDRVALYANINRRTRDRTPAGFAVSAVAAMRAGFDAIKIAPFDEVTAAVAHGPDFGRALDHGLARIAAVRTAIGDGRRLMVDCHWRFNEVQAAEAMRACVPFDLHWFECPLPETAELLPAIARLRKLAQHCGFRLAGGEDVIGVDSLRQFLAAAAYDVIMPDVKYTGGLGTMMQLAEEQRAAGVVFSPHNPSGPIAHAASLEVCAAVDDADLLELQFDETPRFDTLVSQGLPRIDGGVACLSTTRIGLGVTVDRHASDVRRG